MEYLPTKLGHFWGFYVGKIFQPHGSHLGMKDGLRRWFSSSRPVNVPRCASGTCPGRFPGKLCARTSSSLRHLEPGLKICWRRHGFSPVKRGKVMVSLGKQYTDIIRYLQSTNSWFFTPKLVYPKVPIFRAINNFCLYFTSQSLC